MEYADVCVCIWGREWKKGEEVQRDGEKVEQNSWQPVNGFTSLALVALINWREIYHDHADGVLRGQLLCVCGCVWERDSG